MLLYWVLTYWLLIVVMVSVSLLIVVFSRSACPTGSTWASTRRRREAASATGTSRPGFDSPMPSNTSFPTTKILSPTITTRGFSSCLFWVSKKGWFLENVLFWWGLYFVLLVTWTVKSLISISQNRITQNKWNRKSVKIMISNNLTAQVTSSTNKAPIQIFHLPTKGLETDITSMHCHDIFF